MKSAVILLALIFISPLCAREKTPEVTEGEKVVLDPFRVKGEATSNFSIDIRIIKDATTRKILRIFITRVAPDSDAAKLGLQVGDEIVSIEQEPVKGMDGRIDIASKIGRYFLNRQTGDELNLEIVMHRAQKITLRADERRGLDGWPGFSGSR